MSAAVETYRDDLEATYAVDFSRDREPIKARKRFPEYRRKGGAPTRVSGMHCRRNKRWTWGSGRGARMLNTRAFARCVAFAVASLAATAFGAPITIPTVVIGNPGNAGNPASNPTNLGSVSDIFRIAPTETSNSDYVAFLNAVDPGGTNPNGVYDTRMTSDTNGGIAFNAGASAGAKYSVKTGSRALNATYATMPVNYVSWFSAARFINWLENGQQSDPTSMEDGTYTLNGATGGSVVARNSGSTYFLPSVDEWYKAAFYNGSTYTDYQTNSNVAPNASLNIALANVGNFAGISGGPMDVGAYANAGSAYGLYEMMGNVTEITETSFGGQFRAMGGGFGAPNPASWNATANPILKNGNFSNVSYGFRVAAVPEPSTFALAGIGIAGLAGVEWNRRRKAKATCLAA